jgi:hypothetical protein
LKPVQDVLFSCALRPSPLAALFGVKWVIPFRALLEYSFGCWLKTYYTSIVDVIMASSSARCKPIVEVRLGRGETGGPPREARNAGPGGAVGAAEEGETKRCGKGRQ